MSLDMTCVNNDYCIFEYLQTIKLQNYYLIFGTLNMKLKNLSKM